jgi:superoxide dismutase, Fe-Mn family
MKRRNFIAGVGVTALAGCLPKAIQPTQKTINLPKTMSYPFSLPALAYDKAALEPYIDAATMEIHHGKHHQAYVNNLNAALEAHTDLHGKTLAELISDIDALPAGIQAAVRNNGGGHHNHSIFWEMISPENRGVLSGALKADIEATFGSVEDFKTKFAQAGATRFGSGWAWLAKDADGKLAVYSTANQDSPVMQGHTPLLGLDVWEHAYYLNYQNRRPDYIAAFWSIVNWNDVEARYNG